MRLPIVLLIVMAQAPSSPRSSWCNRSCSPPPGAAERLGRHRQRRRSGSVRRLPGRQPNRLYRNDGGTFVDVAAAAASADLTDTRAAAWGDFDGDGDIDLYVGFTAGRVPNKLYRNDGDGSHFTDVARGPRRRRASAKRAGHRGSTTTTTATSISSSRSAMRRTCCSATTATGSPTSPWSWARRSAQHRRRGLVRLRRGRRSRSLRRQPGRRCRTASSETTGRGSWTWPPSWRWTRAGRPETTAATGRASPTSMATAVWICSWRAMAANFLYRNDGRREVHATWPRQTGRRGRRQGDAIALGRLRQRRPARSLRLVVRRPADQGARLSVSPRRRPLRGCAADTEACRTVRRTASSGSTSTATATSISRWRTTTRHGAHPALSQSAAARSRAGGRSKSGARRQRAATRAPGRRCASMPLARGELLGAGTRRYRQRLTRSTERHAVRHRPRNPAPRVDIRSLRVLEDRRIVTRQPGVTPGRVYLLVSSRRRSR